jgi:hypothetical protein
MTTATELREYIARKQQQIEDLEKRHGTGVRPGWVGEEISILQFYKRDAERMLKLELEKNNGTD